MSTRPTPSTPTTPPHPRAAASNADRLSQVLAAGLERQLSLETCRPCKRQPEQRLRSAAAPTNKVVDYDKETDWATIWGDRYPNGPRFTKGCPDDEPGCDDKDYVPVDGVTLEEFDQGKPIIILECGHCFNIENLARWVIMKKSTRCIYNDHDMTEKELAELGLKKVNEEIQLLQPGVYLNNRLKQEALTAANQDGLGALREASDVLRNDKEVVLAAVNQFPWAFFRASDAMKKDKDVSEAWRRSMGASRR